MSFPEYLHLTNLILYFTIKIENTRAGKLNYANWQYGCNMDIGNVHVFIFIHVYRKHSSAALKFWLCVLQPNKNKTMLSWCYRIELHTHVIKFILLITNYILLYLMVYRNSKLHTFMKLLAITPFFISTFPENYFFLEFLFLKMLQKVSPVSKRSDKTYP